MKKTISAIIILLLFLIPALGGASYLIRLKNGRQLTTPAYWFEGDHIYFNITGGVMGIEKASVRVIEALPASPWTDAENKIPARVKPPEESASAATTKVATLTTAVKKTAEDQRFMKEFDLLKNRVKTKDTLTIPELYALEKELTAFRNKILTERLTRVYADQLQEIVDMGGELENLLKARGQ